MTENCTMILRKQQVGNQDQSLLFILIKISAMFFEARQA